MFDRIKRMFAARAPTEYCHPVFGRFEGVSGLWTVRIAQGGHSFDLVLSGSDAAPDRRLLTTAEEVLTRFEELCKVALDFLIAHEPLALSGGFTVCGLELLWEDRPEEFTFEFLDGNDDIVWRVGFVSGEPKFTGFDD